ncbi:MAG: ThiF family adenylyltransferase [Phycisphaerales bacterium]|nr:MAG: ThiF family adenylyltransferase [Phycisphaerales bacterium]
MQSNEEEIPSQPEGQERYQRNLGTLGLDGQRTLFSSRIVIVGLGGLGGHVLEQMARAGAGHITGIDPDVFEASNLNRQILSDVDSMGVSKVQRAKERIEQVRPETVFVGMEKRHTDADERIWAQADLVFDCLDSITDRLSLAQICSNADCTLIHGAIAGWYGQVAVVRPGSGLLTRLYPETGPGLEKELGTPPFTAALVASLMVAEGVKVICGINKEDRDRVKYIDLKDGSLWSVDV